MLHVKLNCFPLAGGFFDDKTFYIKSKFASAFKQFELKYGIKKLSIRLFKRKGEK